VTTTVETGRHVTPGRIQADAARLETEHFILRSECQLSELELVIDLRRMGWMQSSALVRLGALRSTSAIPGESGRFA